MKNFFQKNWWIAAVVILVIIALVVVLVTTKQNPPTNDPTTVATTEATTAETTTEATVETTVESTEPQQTEEIVVPTEETIAFVTVEIFNYEFTLNEQLAQTVSFRELADTDALDAEAYTKLGDREYTLFTIIFQSVEGDIVHMLGNAEGEKIPVAFVMNQLPEGLSDEEATEFYIAQGTVNDVMSSIKAK